MELHCSSCGVSLTLTSWGTTYNHCGHNICHECYFYYHQPRVCVVCTFKKPAAKGDIPETHSGTAQPRPPLHPAPLPSALPHPTPDFTTPSRNTTRTNTTHPSTSQNHTSEDSRQSSLWRTEDNRRPNDSQQREWGREMGQPGKVQELRKIFDGGIIAAQEGAAGWQKAEEDPRAPQGSIQTLWQQEPISRSRDPYKPDSVTGIHSSTQLGKEQKTPHTRKYRSPPPYTLKSPKDEYLTTDVTAFDFRETLPSPPRSRNASPSPSSTSDRSRISSSSTQRPAHRSHSRPRTRETKHSSPSPTRSRDSSPSPSPSGPPNLAPSPSLARKPSPAPAHHCRSSSRTRETGHSSPSLASPTVPPSSPSRIRDFPPSPSSAPTTPKESLYFNFAVKDAKFPGKVVREWSAEDAASPIRTSTQQPYIKSPLIPIVTKAFTSSTSTTTQGGVVVNGCDVPQHHQTNRNFGDGLNQKTQGMEMKERGGQELKHEDNQQQSESFGHEEEDHKHQEEYAQLRDLSVSKRNESLVEERDESGGQIRPVTQENVEVYGEVTALREAKDRAEKEAMYWKEENAKQQGAARQEVDQFRKEQVRRLQEHRDNWEGRMKEMQTQITSQEQEKKQLREKSNRLENDLQQVTKDLAKCKEDARQLERENAHQQQEKVKCGEEEKRLREQIYAKDAQLGEVERLYQEEIKKMQAAEEEEIKRLMIKDIQNQEELATLRSSKEDVRCLIRERDSLQEEVDKLKKEETTRKKNMARLREEKEDWRLKFQEFENKVAPLSRKFSEKVSACQREIDELKRKEATLHREATRLRRERDQYRDEADQLKGRENSYINKVDQLKWSEEKITELQQERDNLKGEVDQLKQATSTEIKERDSYKEAIDTLKEEVATLKKKVRDMRRERDSYKEESDRLKAKEDHFNQMTERDNNRRIEDSKMAQMELEIKNYKTKIVELEGKEDTLRKQIIQMERKTENHQQKVDAEISRLRRENERVGGYSQREETLKKQIDEMETEREDLIQQLLGERDEVEKLTRQENTLEKQLTEVKTDRDKYKRERDEHKETADKLMRSNFTVTAERDYCLSGREQERVKHKDEVERLKMTYSNEMTRLREERDHYKMEAWRLKELEVASGAAATRHMEVPLPKEDLADIPTPPAPLQAAEDIEMVTAGSRRKEEEEEEVAITLGLPNLGNSCYINGVVQCLYHLPPLRNALAHYSNLQYQDQSETGVAPALAQLFGAMKSGDNSVIRFVTRDLKQVLGSHDEAFKGRQQQEAHDLFSAITTWLQDDLRQFDGLDTSRGSSLFEGHVLTRMVCQEKGRPYTLTHNKESFTSISLPVVGVNTWSLKDLLDKNFKKQTLEWDCDSCRYPHQCDSLTDLLACPPVLVIHFSRVPNPRSRRKTKVDFPVSELSLQKYMEAGADSPRSPTYKLVGVLCHYGNMGGGHYTAYCRYGRGPRGNRWRICNDEQVWDVDERKVLSDENAHLLFYIQQ